MQRDDFPGADIHIEHMGCKEWGMTILGIAGLLVMIGLLMLMGVSGMR